MASTRHTAGKGPRATICPLATLSSRPRRLRHASNACSARYARRGLRTPLLPLAHRPCSCPWLTTPAPAPGSLPPLLPLAHYPRCCPWLTTPAPAPGSLPPLLETSYGGQGPLGIPSIHLIGESDPSRPFSVAASELYASEPTAATRDVFSSLPAASPPHAAGAADSIRVVLTHPNDHMPPRQKESAQAVLDFARRFSPQAPSAEVS